MRAAGDNVKDSFWPLLLLVIYYVPAVYVYSFPFSDFSNTPIPMSDSGYYCHCDTSFFHFFLEEVPNTIIIRHLLLLLVVFNRLKCYRDIKHHQAHILITTM